MNNIKATIEIKEFYLPGVFQSFIDSIDTYKLTRESRNILKDGRVSINQFLDSSFSKTELITKNDFQAGYFLKHEIKEKIGRTIDNSNEAITNIIENQINKNEVYKFYKSWKLVILNIENTGEKEVKGLQIENADERFFSGDGYYEIEINNQILRSMYFRDIINLPPLRGHKNINIKIWTYLAFPEDLKITHPNGVIKPQEVINVKGFYAWATKNLNSFGDFYTLIFFPLFIVFGFIYFYRQIFSILRDEKRTNKNDN